jgi:hypothetical protein
MLAATMTKRNARRQPNVDCERTHQGKMATPVKPTPQRVAGRLSKKETKLCYIMPNCFLSRVDGHNNNTMVEVQQHEDSESNKHNQP